MDSGLPPHPAPDLWSHPPVNPLRSSRPSHRKPRILDNVRSLSSGLQTDGRSFAEEPNFSDLCQPRCVTNPKCQHDLMLFLTNGILLLTLQRVTRQALTEHLIHVRNGAGHSHCVYSPAHFLVSSTSIYQMLCGPHCLGTEGSGRTTQKGWSGTDRPSSNKKVANRANGRKGK